jgi:hypothetical protein
MTVASLGTTASVAPVGSATQPVHAACTKAVIVGRHKRIVAGHNCIIVGGPTATTTATGTTAANEIAAGSTTLSTTDGRRTSVVRPVRRLTRSKHAQSCRAQAQLGREWE